MLIFGKKSVVKILLVISVALNGYSLFPSLALAQSSEIVVDSLTGGGAVTSTSGYRLSDSIGQQVVGAFQETSKYRHEAGLWPAMQGPKELTAEFSAVPTSGDRPLTVQFTDQSTGVVTSYLWDFGDSQMSTEQSLSHEYTQAGDYTVSLSVTGPGGSDTETKTDYIRVREPGEIIWQREYAAMVEWRYVAGAYTGGMGYSRPVFVDIDNDNDLDMFIGENNGNINFHRNDGTPEFPSWTLVTQNYNSIDVGYRSTPTFTDIDNDGDYDLFIGEMDGNINFYRNDGTSEAPSWTLVTEDYNSIDVGYNSPLTFIDIDNDGDYDMFIGENDGNINFYRNDGTPEVANWAPVDEDYNSIDVGDHSSPTFIDIDNDGDYDMFIGEGDGNMNFYRNGGTPESASWIFVTEDYNSIDVGDHSSPTFIDIDNDGDYDMFIGKSDGTINFYENSGTPVVPSWTLATENYNPIDVGSRSRPTFTDIDNDGDYDLFIGEVYGNINFYQNDGTPEVPIWTLVTENYNSIDVGDHSSPTFIDIDNDGDYDMFIGENSGGNIHFYRNDGTPEVANWAPVDENYNSIYVRFCSVPTFTDIDNDGDYDMFIGEFNGNVHFYQNNGTPEIPIWTLVTENYNSIDVGSRSTPTFTDIDNDGDYDMFIGEFNGNINFYRNDGTPESPGWVLITENYNSINVGMSSSPTFTDIDSDGDYDMFIGEWEGGFNFYRNMTIANNTPPIIAGLPDKELDEDITLDNAIDLWNHSFDAETPHNGLTYTITQNTNPQCGVTIDSNRFIDINPQTNWHGTSNVTVRVKDSEGLYYEDVVVVTVNPVNDPPVVSNIPDQTIDEGQSFTTITLDNYVEDPDNADSELTWTATGNTELGVSIVDRIATVTAPHENYNGSETITFRAKDPGLLYDETSAVFTVNAAEIPWQREYGAMVDGRYLAWAYTGGMGHSKPAFVDIDNDSDYDLFIGERYGTIHFYRNDGTSESPSWTLVTENYNSIDVGFHCSPTFTDIDNDGDYDLFIGEEDGNINFYRNGGTPESPNWTLVTENYNSINIGYLGLPAFNDIDNDGDYDMFIGEVEGNINFYRNDGTPEIPNWTLVTENYNSIDVGICSLPTFTDIDNDADYDLFIGEYNGNINFYRNDGTPEVPNWTLVTENYNSIDVGYFSSPTLVDIDNDSDYDLFIGEWDGNIIFYKNDGSIQSPLWTFITRNYVSVDAGAGSIPTFCDIDSDNDYDMFIGNRGGTINFYRNDGTLRNPNWILVTSTYNSIDFGSNAAPTFCDIDNDGDYDMFIGEEDGNINFYRNDGTPEVPNWTLVTENYNSIDVGSHSVPAFIDIDNDGDYDIFIGKGDGTINFYENGGTPIIPYWTLASENYNLIDAGNNNAPTFTDIDNDGDYDLFIGEEDGNINFYRNGGTPEVPNWTLVTENYNSIDVGGHSTPIFTDIDNDGDYDMFIGKEGGGIHFYRNMTVADNTPPIIAGLPDKELDEGTTLDNAIGLWNHSFDAETPHNGLTYTISKNTNPDCGVTIDSNRFIDIKPAQNWSGQSDVTVKVTDPKNLFAEDVFKITVTTVNDPPVLEWTGEAGFEDDGLNPEIGYGSTDFTFKIKYKDADNNQPVIHKVRIDKNGDGDYSDAGEANDMTTTGTDYAAGVIYSYTTTITYSSGSQNCSYYFEFSDGIDSATGNITTAISPATAVNKPDVFQTLSLTIDHTNWPLSNIQAGSEHITDNTNKIRVTNNGDGLQTYSLVITDESPDWSASSDKNTGIDEFVLGGLFTEDSITSVDSTYFNEVASDDVILKSASSATSTRFGSTRTAKNGSSVPAGKKRNLWLEFKAPAKDTTAGATHPIKVSINAEVP